MQYVIEKS